MNEEERLARLYRRAERAEERAFLRFQAIKTGEEPGELAEARAAWLAALRAEAEADDARIVAALGWPR